MGRRPTRRGAVLVVCLDDVNHLVPKRVLNDVLIRILRLHEFSPGARTGVYPGVVPAAVLDDVAQRTVRCGDLRIGMDLMKGAVYHAERAGRETVTVEDVGAVFAVARRTRLTSAVQTLTPMERSVLAVLAGMMERGEETTSGQVYEAVTEVEPMGYTMFHERVQRLEGLGLVRTRRRRKGEGWTREIVVRGGVGEVVSGAVSAGSSEESSHALYRHSGVAER